MNKYIVLFRGINVGGNNIIPMKDLREILEDIGCVEVQTYIQSGNVVLQSAEKNSKKLTKEISKRVIANNGFEPKVMLLQLSDFQTAIKNNPFKTVEGKTLHFFFLDTPSASPDLKQIEAIKSANEEFQLINNVFYLYAPDGIGRSKLASKVEKCLGVPVTARNWNTVRKLISLAEKATT